MLSATNLWNGSPLKNRLSEPKAPLATLLVLALYFAPFDALRMLSHAQAPAQAITSPAPFPGPEPPHIAPEIAGRTGDFAGDIGKDTFIILERGRRLILR